MNTQEFIRKTPYMAWSLMFASLCWGLFSNFYGSLTPEISAELSLSPQNLGFIIMVMSGGGALGAFLGGDLAQRMPPRPLMLVYLALILISILLIVSGKYTWACLGYGLYTAISTAIMTISHSMLAHLKLSEGMRPRLLAVLDVGFSAGATLSPLWVAVLLKWHVDWRLPYLVFLMPLLAFTWSLFNQKANEGFQQIIDDTLQNHSDHADANITQASYTQLIFAPWARWTWICGILIGYVEWSNAYWFVNYAINSREIDANHARIGLASFTGGMMLIRIWQAFYHSTLSGETRMKRLCVVGTAMFIGLSAMPNHAHIAFISSVNFLAGIGIGIVFPMLLNHLIELAPQDTSKCSALLILCIILGSQLGGLLIGFLATHINIWTGYATIAVAMAGFSFGVWQIYQPSERAKYNIY